MCDACRPDCQRRASRQQHQRRQPSAYIRHNTLPSSGRRQVTGLKRRTSIPQDSKATVRCSLGRSRSCLTAPAGSPGGGHHSARPNAGTRTQEGPHVLPFEDATKWFGVVSDHAPCRCLPPHATPAITTDAQPSRSRSQSWSSDSCHVCTQWLMPECNKASCTLLPWICCYVPGCIFCLYSVSVVVHHDLSTSTAPGGRPFV